jgi:hypothetical protein
VPEDIDGLLSMMAGSRSYDGTRVGVVGATTRVDTSDEGEVCDVSGWAFTSVPLQPEALHLLLRCC